MVKFARGSVWWYRRDAGDAGITTGTHPCVVISSNEWNENSDTVIIVPCTTSQLPGTLKAITLTLDSNDSTGYFYPTQITTVPKKWLFNYQGMLDPDEVSIVFNGVTNLISDACNLSLYNRAEYSKSVDSIPATKVGITTDGNGNSEVRRKHISIPVTVSRNSWSEESKREFLDDCINHSAEVVAEKYNLGSVYTVNKYKKRFYAETK